MYGYDFYYNGEPARGHGVYVASRPDIPAPERRVEYIQIAGRDSTLLSSDESYQDIDISIELGYVGDADGWSERFRELKAWLLLSGGGELQFSDDLSYYRRVKNIVLGTNERTSRRIGRVTPVFTCEPYEYLVSGKKALTEYKKILNPYMTSKPIYLIEGNGTCSLTVNGQAVRATIGQNLTLHTEKMIAYREDSGEMNNTAVEGDYEDLYLKPGENSISITSGYTLRVIPNWRRL